MSLPAAFLTIPGISRIVSFCKFLLRAGGATTVFRESAFDVSDKESFLFFLMVETVMESFLTELFSSESFFTDKETELLFGESGLRESSCIGICWFDAGLSVFCRLTVSCEKTDG